MFGANRNQGFAPRQAALKSAFSVARQILLSTWERVAPVSKTTPIDEMNGLLTILIIPSSGIVSNKQAVKFCNADKHLHYVANRAEAIPPWSFNLTSSHMKILVAHNSYQHRGGEDVVVDAEILLLRKHGHEVQLYQRHNDELRAMSMPAAANATIWSQRSARDIERLCEQFNPDVIHVHNTLPLISPSIYWAASRRNIPVVQTLHNFRLICPQGMLLREGKVCEDCVGNVPWRAVTRKCYRDSHLQSAVVSGMLTAHHALGTYREKITRYIVLNSFCKNKFIASGMAPDLFRIKPNFFHSTMRPSWNPGTRHGGIFIGRLSAEKGLDVLLQASKNVPDAAIKIVGKGPLEAMVQEAFPDSYLGFKPSAEVERLLGGAQYLIVPSTCYETFGLVAIEAFACGTPVIASRHGGLGELINDGVTGLLFTPGDADELAEKISWANAHPGEMLEMGKRARAEYETKFTPEKNYLELMNIYEEAIEAIRAQSGVPAFQGSEHAA